jgi:glycine/D-amino acid oxidase-like deaminating enzyme
MLDVFRRDKIPTLASVDVLVVGAGSAGCVAALAARESGEYSVALVERYGFAGGTSTQILDTFLRLFHTGRRAAQSRRWLPDRVVNELDAVGAMFLRPNTYGAGTGITYNPERLKLVWDQLLEQAGVRVLLHATLVDVEAAQDGTLRGVIIWTKSGFCRIEAKRFIDASGDADLCYLAGLPFEKAGEIDPAQTMTTTFKMAGCQSGSVQSCRRQKDAERAHGRSGGFRFAPAAPQGGQHSRHAAARLHFHRRSARRRLGRDRFRATRAG